MEHRHLACEVPAASSTRILRADFGVLMEGCVMIHEAPRPTKDPAVLAKTWAIIALFSFISPEEVRESL